MMNRRTAVITVFAAAASLMLASCTPESPPLDPPGYGINTTASDTEKSDAGNTTTTSAPAETTTTPETYDSSGVQNTPPRTEETAQTHKDKDRWYRIYKLTGGEREAGNEDYIEVEYNQKDNYVSMHMMFIGVNAYMSVNSTGLVPSDGEYWIQDFMNADGSAPDLTKVYMSYTSDKIMLFYWDDSKDGFDFSHGQIFVFSEEFTG